MWCMHAWVQGPICIEYALYVLTSVCVVRACAPATEVCRTHSHVLVIVRVHFDADKTKYRLLRADIRIVCACVHNSVFGFILTGKTVACFHYEWTVEQNTTTITKYTKQSLIAGVSNSYRKSWILFFVFVFLFTRRKKIIVEVVRNKESTKRLVRKQWNGWTTTQNFIYNFYLIKCEKLESEKQQHSLSLLT